MDERHVTFRKLNQQHIDYFKEIMNNERTKNLSLLRKRRLMRERFPGLEISKSTIHKIVKITRFLFNLVAKKALKI